MKFTKFKTERFALILCSGALALLCSSAFADSTIVVNPNNMDGWGFYSTDSSGALGTGANTGQMVFGPATPPLGNGSANLMTAPGGGDGSEQLRGGSSFDGTLLSSLTSLSYHTYASSIGGDELPYLQLYVNYTGGTTVNDRIIFEPVYSGAGAGNGNPNPQPNIALNTWQTWNALNGMWYTVSGTPDANAFPGDPNGPGDHAITFGEFTTMYPNAVIVDSAPGVGGIRFTSGFSDPSDNYDTNLDDFTIGVNGVNTTFDFEPVPEASTWVAAGLAAAMLIVQLVRAQAFSKRAALAHGKGKR